MDLYPSLTRRSRRLAARLLLVCLTGAAGALDGQSAGEWSAYTSMTRVGGLLADGHRLWAITSGGLLRYDARERTYSRFTRLDGLAGNLVTSAAVDSAGNLWFGTDHLGLSRYRTAAEAFDPAFLDFGERNVHALLASGDRLFVATDRGISTFLIGREEVKESYRQLGLLPKDTEVRALALFGGRLWAGTDSGIASADLSSPNLQDPDNWTSVASGAVRDFAVHADTLYYATSSRVWALAGPTARMTIDTPDSLTVAFADLESHAGTVYGADDNGQLWRRVRVGEWVRQTDVPWRVTALSQADTSMWLGTPSGIRLLRGIQPPLLRDTPANNFHEMVIAPDASLWVASVPKDIATSMGVYQFNGEDWRVYNATNGLPSNAAGDVAVDARGQVWVGTWGKGLAVRDTSGAWHTLNQNNSPLHGCCDENKYVVVTDIQRDRQGIMWVGNIHTGLIAMDGYPPTRTMVYGQAALGLGPRRDMGEFAIAPDGLKWIATPVDGFVLFDDGGTPFMAGDEHSQVFSTLTEARLPSDRASAALVDAAGRVWIGTDNGLVQITGSYTRATHTFRIDNWRVFGTSSGLPSSAVTALAEDAQGNVWVGTEAGLAQIGGASGAVTFALTTSNSGLIDDRVNALLYDRQAGALWVGTLNGLSRLRLEGGANPDKDRVVVFPNPLRLGSARAQATIAGLPLGAAVSIYTSDGQLVRRLEGTPGQGTATWDGLNQAGYLVASGIYLFVATDADGNRVRGRLAAVHGQ